MYLNCVSIPFLVKIILEECLIAVIFIRITLLICSVIVVET